MTVIRKCGSVLVKTTIELPDATFQQAQALAASRALTLKRAASA